MATKKKRNRTRRTFDASKANPETLVTIRDISDYTGYSVGYLYNVRKTKLPKPVINTGRSLRFRFGDVKEAVRLWDVVEET